MKITVFKAKFKKLTIEEQTTTIAEMEKGGDRYKNTEYYNSFLSLITWCKLNKHT